MEKKIINREAVELIVALTIAVIFAGFIPSALGLWGHGFENPTFQSSFIFYGILLVLGAVIFVGFRVAKIFFNKEDFFTLIHDPEEAIIPQSINPFKSALVFFLVSLLLATIIGLIGVQKGTFFVSAPQALFPLQQVSKLSELYFGADPAATAETVLFAAIMFIIITILNFTLFKNAKGWRKYVYLILIPLIIGGLGMGYHSMVYGGQEVALTYTFIFWFMGSFITLLFGSIIFWWVWHFTNNLFITARSLAYSKDSILITTILLGVIIYIPVIFYLLRRGLKKKKK